MLKNYLKIAWRNLLKDPQFTFLNLVGLSAGLACTLLIYLWVTDEFGVDAFHKNGNRLYQVMINQKNSNDISTIVEGPGYLARSLKEEMPEVEYAAGVISNAWYGKITLSSGEDNVKASGHFADKDFFSVFSYDLLQGNREQVLTDKNSIVISKDLAMRLFHTTDNVIGKTVKWQHETSYAVSGIFDGPPANSSDQFDFVIPLDHFLDVNAWDKMWYNGDPSAYIVVKEGTDVARLDHKIAGFVKTKFPESNETLFLRPYSKGYLYGKYQNGVQSGGRIEYVRLFSIIALFILLIACINFMNLSTAKASRRLKEMGIKKVVGATRGNLIIQYLGESLLISFLSLLITIGLVAILLPQFNVITGKKLTLHMNAGFIFSVLGITIFTGIMAGSYPALYLSGFNPVSVLKGKLKNSVGDLWVRKGLVIFQFTVTTVFIIAIMIVYKQIEYIQTTNPGYTRDNIINFDVAGISAESSNSFLAEMKNTPGIADASGMDHTGLFDYGTSVAMWQGKNPSDIIQFSNIGIGYDMVQTLGLQIIAGRGFSRTLSSDSSEVVLNQAAVDAMRVKDPIGRKIQLYYGDPERTIVGVVKNFHFESLHENVKPFALRLAPKVVISMMAKLKAGTERQGIDRIQELYKVYHPGFPFEYRFLDDDFQAQYVAERRVSILSRYFGGLAILISCLGLFGLAAFTAQRRYREIGIRKVLGATETNVVVMLTKDFLKLVLISVFIACPLAWWATNQWLNSFAYRVDVGFAVFLIAGGSTILITLLTISYQAIRAALTNPVRSLRTE